MPALKLIPHHPDVSIKAMDQTRQQMEKKHFQTQTSHSGHKKHTGHIKYLQIQAKKCHYANGRKISPVKKQDLLKLFTRPRPTLLLLFSWVFFFFWRIFNSESGVISHMVPTVVQSGGRDRPVLVPLHPLYLSLNSQLCALNG